MVREDRRLLIVTDAQPINPDEIKELINACVEFGLRVASVTSPLEIEWKDEETGKPIMIDNWRGNKTILQFERV